MSDIDINEGSASKGIKIDDIYFVLFKHKWKIILFGLIGIAATTAVYFTTPRIYESNAKVLIRYIEERQPIDPSGGDAQVKSPDLRGDRIINSELEILSSFDLARSVARVVGPDKILGDPAATEAIDAAAVVLSKGLELAVPEDSKIIRLKFSHTNPAIVTEVLEKLIEQYKTKHLTIHRASGFLDEFFTAQRDRLNTSLAEDELKLRSLKKTNVIISLPETKAALIEQITKLRGEFFSTQAELQERRAALKGMQQEAPGEETEPGPGEEKDLEPATAGIPQEVIEEFVSETALAAEIKKQISQLKLRFTEENPAVIRARRQLESQQGKVKELLTVHPRLAEMGLNVTGTNSPALNVGAEISRINSLEAKLQTLTNQLATIREEAVRIDEAGSLMEELQRRMESKSASLKFFKEGVDQARMDAEIGVGNISNIPQVQAPSPPVRSTSKLKKIAVVLLFGSFGFGVGLAFLIELILNQSVKRPEDIEAKLELPLFMSFPIETRKRLKNAQRNGNGGHSPNGTHAAVNGEDSVISYSGVAWNNGKNELAPWDESHPLRSYFEALRDRLVALFEMKNMTHKPKMVALTSCSKGAGVSTVATGLAASLSETGGGNVLLVDMNTDQGAAHPISNGRPGCALPEGLDQATRDEAMIQDNLYMVVASKNDDKLPKILPKRFSHLLPKMKASDYDYIIFDMPPVSQTSVTASLAAFMDMTFLVVESEKTNRDSLKRAIHTLADADAAVTSLLNKQRNYLPSWLRREA